MKKRQLIIVGAAALIFLTGVAGFRLLASMKKAPARKEAEEVIRLVRSRTVETDTLSKTVRMQGKLSAVEKVELFPEVTGKNLGGTHPFKTGQSFNSGDVLLAIDPTETRYSLQSQRSALIASLSQVLPDIKIDYADSYATWESFFEALNPESDLPSLPALDDGKLKRFLSSRNVLQQYYSIKGLEDRLEKFTIRAPFDGTLTMGNLDKGTVIRAGQKIGEFIRTDAYELEAALPIEDAQSISVGDAVELKTNDASSTYSGRISRMAASVSVNDQTIAVFVRIDDPRLKEGMYLNGNARVDNIPEATRLPRILLQEGPSVYTIQDGVLALTPVNVIDISEGFALITGLDDGDVILDQAIEGAFEGMPVRIAEATE